MRWLQIRYVVASTLRTALASDADMTNLPSRATGTFDSTLTSS